MTAKTLQPVIVDAQHFVSRLVVAHSRSDAENAKNNLGIDTVTIHVFDPLIGVARAAHALFAVFIEAGLGHLIDPVVLPRDEFSADRSDAPEESHIYPGLRDPVRTIGAVLDERHAVLQFPLRLRNEQLRGQPRQIEVTIGRDSLVLHRIPPFLSGPQRSGQS